jgi:hypothetical protein
MRPNHSMSAVIMLSILMASSMGCIGLVPAREFMEDMRGEAYPDDVKQTINIEHIFVTDITNVTQTTSYSNMSYFEVDSNVTQITAYITAAMPLELFIPGVPTEVRYVRATLTDSDGTDIWVEEITETERKMVATFQQPLAVGTWTLSVDARGYGEEVLSLYKDSFQVIVKIDRVCWIYPPDKTCSYD